MGIYYLNGACFVSVQKTKGKWKQRRYFLYSILERKVDAKRSRTLTDLQTNHLCAYLHENLLKDPSSVLAVF